VTQEEDGSLLLVFLTLLLLDEGVHVLLGSAPRSLLLLLARAGRSFFAFLYLMQTMHLLKGIWFGHFWEKIWKRIYLEEEYYYYYYYYY